MSDASMIDRILTELVDTIRARAEAGQSDQSYTASLLAKGPNKIAKKLIEEAGELGLALATESNEDVANEAADVLYHLLVGLQARGVCLDEVARVLATRQGLSGLEEKASRTD